MAAQMRALQPHLLRATVFAIIALFLAPGLHVTAAPERPLPFERPGGLLSTPMPGTSARAYADLSSSLGQALSGFNGVTSAAVMISGSPDTAHLSPDVAIQLTLTDGFAPTPAWLEAIRAFSLRTIPHLAPNSLTIVDSTGRILHDGGEVHIAAHRPPPATRLIDETFRFEPWWLWTAGTLGFLLVIAGIAIQFFLRRKPAPALLEREPGPLDFLDPLSDDQLAELLTGERMEVVGAVMALAPAPLAIRLQQHNTLQSERASQSQSPDPAMTAALARTLRAKLAHI